MLGALVLGMALGVLFDGFRILRVAFKAGVVAAFLQDCLFWGITALCTFLYITARLDGEPRVFVLLCELLGFFVYYFTIGRLVV